MRQRLILMCTLTLIACTSCSIPRWPVNGVMTSPYGLRLRGWSPDMHEGVDVAAPTGTPVHAMKSGRVVHAGNWGGYGLSVMMSHGTNVQTLYAHLSRIDVSEGEEV
ncbi:MAG TPA: M23 family metallopeptidase, partial [Longimicrobiales bacterium]|nr:M23 family metallopeptidase [Longimicrobiales bacterium]